MKLKDENIFEHNGKPIKCKELHIVQGTDYALCSAETVSFCVDNINITIEQLENRIISLISDSETEAEKLDEVFIILDKLIMLFDGRFIPVKSIQYKESAFSDDNVLNELSNRCLERRLNCFRSADYCLFSYSKLIKYDTLINAELYNKWKELVDEADLMYQVYLYCLAQDTLPIDGKIAFLIEAARPMVELAKCRSIYFTSFDPVDRQPTLKMCVDGLITTYGQDIFDSELKKEYENFLKLIPQSRNRIMHIKRNQKEKCFSPKESLYYIIKFSFLYRRIFMEYLGIPYDSYKQTLIDSITAYENMINP